MSSDENETRLFWQKVTELFYNCRGKDKVFSKSDEERFYRDFQMLKLQCHSEIIQNRMYGDKSLPLVELIPQRVFPPEESDITTVNFPMYAQRKGKRRNEEIEMAQEQRYDVEMSPSKESRKQDESREEEEEEENTDDSEDVEEDVEKVPIIPASPIHPKSRNRMMNWMKEIGLDKRLRNIFLRESGARNLRDVCNYVRDIRIVREIFGKEMNEEDSFIFTK